MKTTKKTNHNIKWSIHCLLTNKILDEEKSNPWRLNYQRIEEKKEEEEARIDLIVHIIIINRIISKKFILITEY
jgi:hypothetical protein